MDYTQSRNLILTSLVLVSGVSSVAVRIGTVQLKGMALGTVVSILASLLFALFGRLGWMNDQGVE